MEKTLSGFPFYRHLLVYLKNIEFITNSSTFDHFDCEDDIGTFSKSLIQVYVSPHPPSLCFTRLTDHASRP